MSRLAGDCLRRLLNVYACVWTPFEKGPGQGGESWVVAAADEGRALLALWKVKAQEGLHAASRKQGAVLQ